MRPSARSHTGPSCPGSAAAMDTNTVGGERELSQPRRLSAIWAALWRALHESRAREAARVIRRHAHLIAEADARSAASDLGQLLALPPGNGPESRPLDRRRPRGTKKRGAKTAAAGE